MSLHTLLARPDIWRGDARGAIAQPVVSSGFASLDAALPSGGWPLGALTEVMPAHEGIGELRLLGPALAAVARSGRMVAWIAPPHLPYAPALAAAGIDLARILVVKTRTPQETLWAVEQALRANACGAVLAWPPVRVKYPELRRLQIAAEGGRSVAVLFRPPQAASESSPAALRLALETAPNALRVRVLKRRGGPLARPIVLDELARYREAKRSDLEIAQSEPAVPHDCTSIAKRGSSDAPLLCPPSSAQSIDGHPDHALDRATPSEPSARGDCPRLAPA
jgi:cell division inhibitor SulA/protein ImuA